MVKKYNLERVPMEIIEIDDNHIIIKIVRYHPKIEFINKNGGPSEYCFLK